jgi:hypothetical protein
MNYEELSDFEINKLVAKLSKTPNDFYVGERSVDRHCENGRTLKIIRRYDPCNNPSDAWPIIVESEMHVIPGEEWMVTVGGGEILSEHKNPLRAAMIVYIMMCDSDK